MWVLLLSFIYNFNHSQTSGFILDKRRQYWWTAGKWIRSIVLTKLKGNHCYLLRQPPGQQHMLHPLTPAAWSASPQEHRLQKLVCLLFDTNIVEWMLHTNLVLNSEHWIDTYNNMLSCLTSPLSSELCYLFKSSWRFPGIALKDVKEKFS